jgi:hypothetical protein
MGGKNEPTDCTPLWIVFWRDDWKLCFVGTLHWLSSTFKISSNLNVGYFLAFPCFLSNAAQSGSLVSRRAGVRFARWVDSVGDAQHTDPSHQQSRTFLPPPAYRARECRQWIIAVREKRQVERVCQSDSRPSIFSYPNAKYITALQFLVSDDYKISSLVWKNPLVRHQQVPSTLWRVAGLVRTRWHDPSSVKKEIFGPRTTESKLLFL